MVFVFECAVCEDWSRLVDQDDLPGFSNAKDEFNQHEKDAHPKGTMGKISVLE